jgi:hypothetical protein
MAKGRRNDYVQGLITGKFEDKVDATTGKSVRVFVPRTRNKYNTIGGLLSQADHLSHQEVLEREGIIYPTLVIDYSVFKKRPREKRYLVKRKLEHRQSLRKAGFNPNNRLNISAPMRLK